MRHSLSVAVASLIAFTACCAGDEFMLVVEELEGPHPKLLQAEDGASAHYGWLPASIDAKPFRVTRTIELRVSTAIDFQLRLNQGGETTELKGKLSEAGNLHTHAPVLCVGPWRAPLAPADSPRPCFVIEYDYSIEERVEDGIADIPSYRRIYAKGSLPINSQRKFYLGGGQNGARAFPTTLWSLKRIEPESGKNESSRVAQDEARSP